MDGPQSSSASEAIDRDLAARVLEKRRRGEPPKREEVRALRRIEKAREGRTRWEFYGSIPQKHWLEMSGRQAKQLAEQHARYGLPWGKTIDLSTMLRAWYEFLARNARKLAAADDEDPLLAGVSSPWLESYRKERTLLARIERREKQRQVLPLDEVHEALNRIAAILRTAGETLARVCGPEAAEILNEALENAQREIDNSLTPVAGDPDPDTAPTPDDPTDDTP